MKVDQGGISAGYGLQSHSETGRQMQWLSPRWLGTGPEWMMNGLAACA